jgi:hypothetical protein
MHSMCSYIWWYCYTIHTCCIFYLNFQFNAYVSFNLNSQFNIYVDVYVCIYVSVKTFNSFPCLCLHFQSLFQRQLSNFMSPSMLTHSQFASRPMIMVMSIFKSNQCRSTLNLYLAKSSFPCILLYVLLLVKWLVRSKEQLVPTDIPVFPVKR